MCIFFIALRVAREDFEIFIGLRDVTGYNVDYKWNLRVFSVVVHFFIALCVAREDFGIFIGLMDVTGNNVDHK